MAHDEDRRWRERMQRDDDNRRYGSGGNRYGEYSNQGSGRGWSEGSEWRNRDRDEWSGSSSGAGYSSRGGSWGDRDRWGERSGSDWDQTSWRDSDRDRNRYEQGGDSWSGDSWGGGSGRGSGSSSRGYSTRDMGQGGWSGGGRDHRQERDYGGSMRAGEYGGRSSSYGGSRYGSGSQGGRSGMGYGGGHMGSSSGSQGWNGREHDQFGGMSSEPGFGSGYGASGYRGMEQGYGYGGPHDWGARGSRSDDRGFWDKAADEVSSWFGDEEAERRREMDRRHSGRGPRNYARSDSRINEDVCDRLTEHPMVDASDIEVEVSGREVTLSGTVHSREEKRRAEDIAEAVSGVTHVQNNLRVKQEGQSSVQSTLDSFANATSGAFGERGGSTMSSRTGSSTSTTGTTGASGSSSTDTPKTTTGSSPGVMRSDPSTSTTKGA